MSTSTIKAIVKQALRVSGNDFDDEIDMLIDAAKEYAENAGCDLTEVDGESSRITHIICVYCKANFGRVNPDEQQALRQTLDLLIAQAATSRSGER